jgi:autotransporter-associated beta strand protein
VTGGGTLTLSGANSYTGPTLISAGVVNAMSDSALGTNSDVTVAGSATLNIPARGSGGLAGTYYNSAPNNAPTYLFADTNTIATYVAGLPVITTDRSSTANSQNNSGAVFDYGASGQGFPSAVLSNPNQFVAVWTGQFTAPTTGQYTFDTGSDDGSMLFIDGTAVVFNNAFQPLTVHSGSVPLTQGSHSIFIAYYQGGGQYGMYADVQIPGGALQRIPNALLNTYGNLQIGSLSGSAYVVIGGTNTLTVGGNNDSAFSGAISGGGNLVKNGTATMTLSGANTYTGATIINQGTLVAAADGALGTAAGGTTVGSGAALGFSSNVNYATAEAVSVAGSGPASNGAIENISGTNSFAGPITLASSASIGSLAGLLTLGGPITGTGPLTFTGAGNITVNGSILSSLSIIKNGAGVVTLPGDSAPNTAVNAGTLNSGAINGTGTTSVSSGGNLIANRIVQHSLVIGGAAGNSAMATIAPSDGSGNPLNGEATGSSSAAISGSTDSPQPTPSNSDSTSAFSTAATSTSASASSEPPISSAASSIARGSAGSVSAGSSNRSASEIVGASSLFNFASSESEPSSTVTTTSDSSSGDRATLIDRQTANGPGNGEARQRDAVAAAFADADILQWEASTPAARPSVDADLSLLSDDLLAAIGRHSQN